jgi:LacI family transcriptional regulator
MLEGVSQYLLETNHWHVFFEDHAVLGQLPKTLSNWEGDGMIVRSHKANACAFLRSLGKPCVELLGDGTEYRPDVGVDERLVGQLAADHFHERGIRNFAYFSADRAWWSIAREQSFRTALRDSYDATCTSWFLPAKRFVRFPLSTIPQELSDTIGAWLRGLPKPVGLFTSIDLHAMLLLGVCRDLGIRVPDEVALLGAGNDALVCSLLSPKLSSVALNSRLVGYRSAVLLDNMMRDPSYQVEPLTVPPTHVVVRQSTDMVAIDDPSVSVAISYIRENHFLPIGVNDIAEHLGVSRRTLERRFRQWMPHSPEAELIKVRLERARELLRDTNLSVAQIGERVGFHSPEYFSNTFRRKQGLTPNRYRMECQVGPQASFEP